MGRIIVGDMSLKKIVLTVHSIWFYLNWAKRREIINHLKSNAFILREMCALLGSEKGWKSPRG